MKTVAKRRTPAEPIGVSENLSVPGIGKALRTRPPRAGSAELHERPRTSAFELQPSGRAGVAVSTMEVSGMESAGCRRSRVTRRLGSSQRYGWHPFAHRNLERGWRAP